MQSAESGQLALKSGLNVMGVFRWFSFILADRSSSEPPNVPCPGPAGSLMDAQQRPHWHEHCCRRVCSDTPSQNVNYVIRAMAGPRG